ncbi:MAG: hypothetical protein WBD75_09845 [Phycisphaerae bacterium]
MAWRPTRYLIEGELNNTLPGKVTGWMEFAGMGQGVTFDLAGDFHRDIRGAKIHLVGKGRREDPATAKYMDGLAVHQIGKVGDITAGLPPRDYAGYPYIEWYSKENGRVVLELEPEQVQAGQDLGDPERRRLDGP